MEVVTGHIIANGARLELGDYEIIKEVSRGANGIVFEGVDTLLARKVAIKIWTKLRANDSRNKIQQGILEARQAYQAKRENVVEVYHAGITNNHFFVVMEYINGAPLKQYLSQNIVLLPNRIKFAHALLHLCDELHEDNIFHGDLHASNILLVKTPELFTEELRMRKGLEYDTNKLYIYLNYNSNFKIIDFGTSHFAPQGFSKKRHFQLIIATIDELLKPLSINQIYGYAYPNTEDWAGIHTWIREYCGFIWGGLIDSGYKELEHYHGDEPMWDKAPHQFILNMKHFLGEERVDERVIGGEYDWFECDY
jgi:serine/threonine protein kinase